MKPALIQESRPFRMILPDQKRLRQAFDEVMNRANLTFEKPAARAGMGFIRDNEGRLPAIETYELRSDAAMDWVSEGAADLIIVGLDMLREYQAGNASTKDTLSTILTMDRISACSMWIAAKPEMYIRDLSDLGDMRLATSYPALLQQLLEKQGVKPSRIIAQKGGVESTIVAGRADAILEIVQTGESLRQNGLETKLLAFNSCATLVRNNKGTTVAREDLISAIARRLEAAMPEGPRAKTQPDAAPVMALRMA